MFFSLEFQAWTLLKISLNFKMACIKVKSGPNWNEGSILVFVLPGKWRRLLHAASDRLTTNWVGEAGMSLLWFRSPQPPSNRPEAHAETEC